MKRSFWIDWPRNILLTIHLCEKILQLTLQLILRVNNFQERNIFSFYHILQGMHAMVIFI